MRQLIFLLLIQFTYSFPVTGNIIRFSSNDSTLLLKSDSDYFIANEIDIKPYPISNSIVTWDIYPHLNSYKWNKTLQNYNNISYILNVIDKDISIILVSISTELSPSVCDNVCSINNFKKVQELYTESSYNRIKFKISVDNVKVNNSIFDKVIFLLIGAI